MTEPTLSLEELMAQRMEEHRLESAELAKTGAFHLRLSPEQLDFDDTEQCLRCGEDLDDEVAEVHEGVVHVGCLRPGEDIA